MWPPLARAANRSTDRKSTRLNSSHLGISYAVFCLKKKKDKENRHGWTDLGCLLVDSRRLSEVAGCRLDNRIFCLSSAYSRIIVNFCFFFFNDPPPPDFFLFPLPALLPI